MTSILFEVVTQSATSLILIAAIAGTCAVAAATIPIIVNGRAARQMQHEDWNRQDAVAQRAVEAVTAAELVAAKADEVATAAAIAYADLDRKLTKIAHQTDGAYTAALESELHALQGHAATLREVVALRSLADRKTDSSRTLAVIEAAETRIVELEAGLKRRREYQDQIATMIEQPPSLSPSETAPPVEVTIVNPKPVDVKIAPDTELL